MGLIETLAGIADHRERAELKAAAVAQSFTSRGRERVGEQDVEIVSCTPIVGKGGIEVFARAWDAQGQIGFGHDGTVDLERFLFFNPSILIERSPPVVGGAGADGLPVVTYDSVEDPVLALREAVKAAIPAARRGPRERIVRGREGRTTATVNRAVIGAPLQSGAAQTWAQLTGGAGNSTGSGATNYLGWRCDSTSNRYLVLRRMISTFDTSVLGEGATVTAATMSCRCTSVTNYTGYNDSNVTVYSAAPASNTVIVDGDYDSLGSSTLSDSVALSAITAGADISFSNVSTASVNVTGYTRLGLRVAIDVSNTAPVWLNLGQVLRLIYADEAAGQVMRLVIDYTGDTPADNGSPFFMCAP